MSPPDIEQSVVWKCVGNPAKFAGHGFGGNQSVGDRFRRGLDRGLEQ